jgi:NADH-quinone oxidoreductase subunit L
MSSSHLLLITFFVPVIAGWVAWLLRTQHALALGISVGATILSLAGSVALVISPIAASPSFQWAFFTFGFYLNGTTFLMLILVNLIALLVQLYSLEYMHHDAGIIRYFSLLNFFIFSMMGIVLCDNLISLYVFWELVGLCSYLLIGFWYQKDTANQAAKKAFLLNRIGDICFLLGIFLTLILFKTSNLVQLSSLGLGRISGLEWQTVAALLLFGGTIGKSAQFPLQSWLPSAMEGPTPVSALLHAATMVAAGIYLLVRINPLFTPESYFIIATIGCIGMLMGGFFAIFQTDIKKTLAYSTISQLGLMVMGLGTFASLFHLFTHAFFKAGLFLAAGSVIHALKHAGEQPGDVQDMRQMGGLRKAMPLTFTGFVVCAAALAGLPLSAGFLSKDLLLTFWSLQPSAFGQSMVVAILLGVVLTSFYMTRQIWLVFGGAWKNKNIEFEKIKESNFFITIPIFILAVFSMAFWISLNPLHADASWIWKVLDPDIVSMQANQSWIPWLSSAAALIGIILGLLTRHITLTPEHISFIHYSHFWKNIGLLTIELGKMSYLFDYKIIDRFVNTVAKVQVVVAHVLAWVEKGVDAITTLFAALSDRIGRFFRQRQNGILQNYVLWMILGLGLLVVCIF